MNEYEYWKKFEQTGIISHYLSYTACTCEDGHMHNAHITHKEKEGGCQNDTGECNRNGSIGHAHWRL